VQCVGDNAIIVAAAIDHLIDAAIAAGGAGQSDAETENFDLAERLGEAYSARTGSRAPLELVRVYRNWKEPQRGLRAGARGLEQESAEARNAKNFERAAKLLNEAIAIYKAIGDKYSEAVVYGSLGIVHWYAGDFNAVLNSYAKALAARRAIEDRILEGKTLNGLGSTYVALERYDEAIESFRQAIELRKKSGDLAGLATSLTYLGNVYMRTGRLGAARDSYEEARPILETTGTPKQRAELLNSVASLYADMGRLRKSNEVYREALEIAVAQGDKQTEIPCRINIASNLRSAFRYREALEEFALVEKLLAEVPDPQMSLLFHQHRGIVHLDVGDVDKAREDFLASLRLAREQGAAGAEVSALINLGYLCKDLGACEQGLAFADSALTKADAHGDAALGREAHELAAELNRAVGRPARSLEDWQRALEYDSQVQAGLRILKDELGIANATALMGRMDEARKLYRGLIPRVREAGSENLGLTIQLGIGHTFERSNPDSARHYYAGGLATIERTRADIGNAQEGSLFLGGEQRYVFEEVARFYARVAKETGDDRWSSEAFRTIESAKARGLLDLIQSSLASDHSLAEETLLDSIARLDKESPAERDEFGRLRRRFEAMKNERLASSTGALASANRIADIRDVQRALPKNTAMCAYALGDSASLLWVIDRKGCELWELPDRRTLERDVEMLKGALASAAAGDKALRHVARKLYRALVEPGAERLGRNERLIIAPDGCLFEIPFEVLLRGEPDEKAGWKKLPIMARSYSILYVPSASIYLTLKEPREDPRYGLDMLALGDPDYASCGSDREQSLTPLPFTKTETEGICSYFKNEARLFLVGGAATEGALKEEIRTHRPRFLHLAAHGLIDPVDPALSSIALCRDTVTRDDGYLKTMEILSLPLDSRLVVLSACESARGRIGRSEGVVGLSRAFIAAGAGGIVASLWPVSDESTSRLMKEFYDRMIDKKRPACVALNEARMALMEEPAYEHPFYWSAFIVIGSERSPW
jgi:CHAT domain-containing protein/Tfp pilus assembly protein PilF